MDLALFKMLDVLECIIKDSSEYETVYVWKQSKNLSRNLFESIDLGFFVKK